MNSYDLSSLSPDAFEHLVNALALRVLGSGHMGFGPGADAGRDGYFEGEAPYPSESERWSGRWYIQSKFHKPNLSKNSQKWLLGQISEELSEFRKPDSKRIWPDIWIVATNIDPSGAPGTGAFDAARSLVRKARPSLAKKFHIWGGQKIIALLQQYPEVSKYYRHFLTPGHVLTELYDQLHDEQAEVKTIIRHLVVNQFDEQQFTKLEQAGSDADRRPGIHALFIDLPFRAPAYDHTGLITRTIVRAAACSQQINSAEPNTEHWIQWRRHPYRARVWFVKGGPGNGKSTIGQYFAQIQRAALILGPDGPSVLPRIRDLAKEVRGAALQEEFWPHVPRIPFYVELKEYAQWFGSRSKNEPRGILSYLCTRIAVGVEQAVLPGTLKRALGIRSWFGMFDGLDEVPDDVKDDVALQVRRFIDEVALDANADLLAVCTSRPQGYSGQFSDLDGPTVELTPLSPAQALKCAEPVIKFGRGPNESAKAIQTLASSIQSEAVRSLMTTPLQSHIMAVVVRDGGKPPDRRWHLFDNFYHVIKRRETNRDLPDEAIARLLREDHKLLKTVHSRLGFVLQARAEVSTGAQTSLNRTEFKELLTEAAALMMDEHIERTVQTLMRATTNRLVLVNTPDDGEHLRFDVRQLQEFFAAEFLYETIDADKLRGRLTLLSGDAHWREVMHFALSALIENGRATELDVAVEVLTATDDSVASPSARVFNRRLARGALMAARLLEEGVLEQDRRVRQQFRKCLEPLLALSTHRSLGPLRMVSQPNSYNWLISFLFDHIREADRTESVGAGILLTSLLGDSDARIEELSEFLLSAPQSYTLAVLRGHPSVEHPRRKRYAVNWVRVVALKLLLRDQWIDLSASDIQQLRRILMAPPEQRLSVAVRIGLPREHVGLLDALLWDSDPLVKKQHPVEDFGIVSIEYFKQDWSSSSVDLGIFKDTLPAAAASAPGILQLVYRIFKFAKDRTPSDLRSLGECVSKHPVAFAGLPPHLRAYAPFDVSHELVKQAQELGSSSDDQLAKYIAGLQTSSPPIARIRRTARLGSTFTLPQWIRLVTVFPDLAWRLWNDEFWTDRHSSQPDVLESPEAIDALVSQLIAKPLLLVRHPLLVGRLLTKAAGRGDEIRTAFCSEANKPRVETIQGVGSSFFTLNLPDESSTLPLIVAALVTMDVFEFANPSNEELRKRTQNICRGFVPKVTDLKTVYEASTTSPVIKAAALLLSLLHPDGGARLFPDARANLVNAYVSGLDEWFFTAVTLYLTLSADQEETISFIIGGLLAVSREDYLGRRILEDHLAEWREKSVAPLTKAHCQHDWLTGSQ